MLLPSHEFFFCFSLRKLSLIDLDACKWENYLRFRIELYRHEHFLSSSSEILCTPNSQDQLILTQENVTFTLHLPDLALKETAEIRLYEITERDTSKLVGCYQFLLGNYVKAYQELNRNSIEVRVHIAEHYVIVYDVLLERTEQALQRLVQEHETAKRFHMEADDISDIDTFLPHEITNYNLEEIYKEIKIDQTSPLILHQRFWSPKRQRPTDVAGEGQNHQSINNTIADQHTRHLLKIHKTVSSLDNLFALNRHLSRHDLPEEEIEVESQSSTQDRYKSVLEVYRVIERDSKIIQPDELEEHEKSRIIEQAPISFVPPPHKTHKKAASTQSVFKIIALVMLLITAAAFIYSVIEASDDPWHAGRTAKRIGHKH